ncbi:unnamed protein product [Orchesella dallaii]|uniref:Uncharacterized protein n=1 Tax=Orchesella dallaii TaxID=48710 RepID=A0ABP1RCD3_9HEXA
MGLSQNNRPLHIMKITARSEESLDILLERYKSLMKNENLAEAEFSDIAYTANIGRASFNQRAILISSTKEEAYQAFDSSILRKECPEEVGKICFLFTGQGSQYHGMAKNLYENCPVFSTNFDRCEKLLKEIYNISIADTFWSAEPSTTVNRTLFSQTGIFVVEYCLLKLWESWGIKPDYVLGHSLGEFAAAVGAGIITLEDAITLVAERSRLIDQLPRGSMLVIKADKSNVENHLNNFLRGQEGKWLDYAALNSNEQTVVAGDTKVVEEFTDYIKGKGVKASMLQSTHAFHSRHMEPMLAEYKRIAQNIKYCKPTTGCRYVSGMLGKILGEDETLDADYWVKHTREKVQFLEASQAVYNDGGCRVFLEIGPHPVLLALTMFNNDGKQMLCVPSLRRGETEWRTLLDCIGKLFVNGVEIKWKSFDEHYQRKKITLPHYPFQRKRYWPDITSSVGTQIHPLLGSFLSNPTSSKLFQSALSIRSLEYLKDHMIGSSVVFPGAGFLEMILVAGHVAIEGCTEELVKPRRPIELNNMRIESPMGLNEESSSVCQVVVDFNDKAENDDHSNWEGLRVKVYHQQQNDSTHNGEGGALKWISHASGNILPGVGNSTINNHLEVDGEQLEVGSKSWLNEKIATFSKDQITSKFYDKLGDVGLKFGPSFRTLESVWRGKQELIAEVKVPEDSRSYLLHPTLIDAMIQAIMVNNYYGESQQQTRLKKRLYVPIGVDKFIWNSELETEKCYIYCDKRSTETSTGNKRKPYAILMSEEGNLVAFMGGMEFAETSVKSIQSLLDQQVNCMPDTWEETFKTTLGPLQHRVFLDPEATWEILYERYNHLDENIKQKLAKSDKLVYYLILNTFYELGWKPEVGRVFNLKEFLTETSICKQHESITRHFLTILHEESILEYSQKVENEWKILKMPPGKLEVVKHVNELRNSSASDDLDVHLIVAVGDVLDQILKGKESALNIMFPKDTSKPSAEHFYEKMVLDCKGSFEDALNKSMNCMLKGNDKLSHAKVLEVGAGTGGLTEALLETLESHRSNILHYEYTYTDLSPAFFNLAEKKFEKYKESLKFKKLNIEEDPSSQGFPPSFYDMVCAFEVIHATRNVRESMCNLRSMLRDGGKLTILETVSPFRKVHFLFGLLEGYWRFQDRDLRPYDATMSIQQWEQVFWESGFINVRSFHVHGSKFGCVEGIAKPNLSLYPMVFSSSEQNLPTWLIFFNNCQLSNGLMEKFDQLQRKYVVWVKKSSSSSFSKINESSLGCELEINPASQEDIAQVFQLCKDRRTNIEGILFAWGVLEEGKVYEDQALIAQPLLYLLQEMHHLPQKLPPRIVVISNGASSVGDVAIPSPCGGTVTGICKSLVHEVTNVHLKLIDVNPNEESKGFQAEEVFKEMFLDVEINTFVVFREHTRYIPKLHKVKLQNKDLPLPNGADRFQLILPTTRSIEDLEFGPLEPFNLKGDEVEIEVKVSALNFKDILNILKPTEEFETSNAVGFDFAGVVKSIGAEVTNLQVGNLVFGVNLNGNGLPSHIKLPSKAVAPIPDSFTLAEAACFPAVFSTAYYCLVTIAKIRKGETILLHTASGGVGLCAIQLAQHYGLNIIATAGNERKRAYLRSLGIQHVFHSRNTDYGQQILDVTDGRGVDIVLNSLTSPGFKEASLKACAKNARFVEMSKLNIWTEVEVKGQRPDVEYTIVDLTKLDESTSQELLREMDTFVKEGIIKPIPYVRFDAVNIRQALTFLQKAKHIGKVVCIMPEVKLDNGNFKTCTPMFNDRSTYLITGGLGGIGLEVAKWMTSSGAKHIVLVSRSPSSEAVQLTINNLISNGSNIVVCNADVGDLEQCSRLIKSIQENEALPPLRGVMHAAGTLSDGFIQNQSWENFEKTYNAKVNGSWNLHELTLELPLEHFVLYSSITGIFGSPGQANHTSGNCFEDNLAHYRYMHGLCATSINWGQWGQVGVAVEYDLPGIAPITTQQGINGLESIMKSHRVQIVVNNVESFSLLFKTFSHLKNYLDERAWKSEFSTGKSFNIKSEDFWEEYDGCGEDRDGKVVVIKKYITITLRHILRLDASDPVDENMELQDMGVDSLMMLEMKNSLQSMFGDRVTVTPASLKDCSTINKLGERLVQIIEEEGEFTSKAPPSLDEIRELIKEDTVLPEDITPDENTLPPVLPTKIKCILVTGATGNLGSYLLSEVLKTCPQLDKIYCLMRGKAGLSPKERLESTLERKCISVGDSVEKIICIEGNLTQPKFGMTDYDYEELCGEVEAILHCGAKISHLEFYRKIEKSLHDIRTINVKGLLNVLEFAVKHRIKHVFNASTMMTVMKIDEDGRMLETWPDTDSFDNISNRGYPVSKHVCDVLLKQAVERGVPCKSFKYPEICGGTNSSSSFNFESRHYMLIHMYMMKEGIMPSVPFPCNVIPVDIAAKITLQICFNHDDAENEMYLVQNPSPQMTQAFFPELAKEFGFPIEIVEYEQFFTRIIDQGEDSFLYHFRDLYKDEQHFVQGVATTPQHQAARKYLENTDDMFVCKKLMRMVPELVVSIESSYEIMKRDLTMAQKEGYFEKFGMVKKTEE